MSADLDQMLDEFEGAMANLPPEKALKVLGDLARGLVIGLAGLQSRVIRLEALERRHLCEQHPGNIDDLVKGKGESE